ncbi:uncharacterized protein [Apostichopus japonicus]|uniref:uncharacterized protein isoform X2 n=1 Tax=Stichopus japonicus TaxID=307972 RepID=UPI003AB4368B
MSYNSANVVPPKGPCAASSEGNLDRSSSRLSRTESCFTNDSDWTSELSSSLDQSQESDVFQSSFPRSVDQLPEPQESSARTAEYVKSLALQAADRGGEIQESRNRRRIWSDSFGSKRSTRSRVWSSDGTGFSSFSSTFSSLQDSLNVSQWVEESLDNNVFDTTVTPDADQTFVEGQQNGRTPMGSDRYPLSKQSSFFDDTTSTNEKLSRTLTEDNLRESVKEKSHLVQSPTNPEHAHYTSPISSPFIAWKREQFRHTESWESSLDSELSLKSVTSVAELLDVVNDPEEFLLKLGFGITTADPLDKIPRRFLERESSATGISVDKYQQEVRERNRGYDFCLTGGLRGLERFLWKQLHISGVQFSPYGSPHSGSPRVGSPQSFPQSEQLPSFSDAGHLSEFSNGVYNFRRNNHQVLHPSPINPSSSNDLLSRSYPGLSKQASKESLLSTDDSFTSDNYESDVSSTGDWSERNNVELRKPKVKAKRLQMANPNLDTVDEELESQLRAKSPCPPSSFYPPLSESRPEIPKEHSETVSHKAVKGDLSKLVKLQGAAPTVTDSLKSEDVVAAIKDSLIARDLGNVFQDSFEIEEGDELHTESGAVEDKRGSLVRNESQQSDSSGFADEGTDSVSPASPQHEHTREEEEEAGQELSDDLRNLTQSNGDSQMEPNNNLENVNLFETVASNKSTDSKQTELPEEDENLSPWSRPRSGSFPFVREVSSGTERPKSVLQVLESLQKNYKIAEEEMAKRNEGGKAQKRRRLFSKMDTVDCDNYSFGSSVSKENQHHEEDVGEELKPSSEPAVVSAMQSPVTKEERPSNFETADPSSQSDAGDVEVLGSRKVERLESEDVCDREDTREEGHPPADEKQVGETVFTNEIYHQVGETFAYYISTASFTLVCHKCRNDSINHNKTSQSSVTRNKSDDNYCSSNNNNYAHRSWSSSSPPNDSSSQTHVHTKVFYCSPPVIRPPPKDSHRYLTAQLAKTANLRSDQMLDQELGLDTAASAGSDNKREEIEAQRELQDLKLMQRALFKYKQDLWELEEWSMQMYDEEADREVKAHVTKELGSLGNLRLKVKKEVQRMETAIEQQIKDIISRRGSMDDLSHRFAHWSFSHIDVLNKMVSLMKEQSSLRKHLEAIQSKKGKVLAVGEEDEESITPQRFSSDTLYKTLSRSDLVQELVNTQLELARLRVMAQNEMTAAIVEMKKCIVSDIRKEVNQELRLMQWQIKDRDDQIGQLRELLRQTKQNSLETEDIVAAELSEKTEPTAVACEEASIDETTEGTSKT